MQFLDPTTKSQLPAFDSKEAMERYETTNTITIFFPFFVFEVNIKTMLPKLWQCFEFHMLKLVSPKNILVQNRG